MRFEIPRGAAPTSLSLSLALSVACGGEPPAAEPVAPAERAVQVRSLALEPRDVIDRASLPADLAPLRRAVLAAEVGGKVEAVEAELGQAVSRGQLLAKIDERSLAQQVAEAEAWLRQAQLQYERAQNLFERKAVTKANLLDAVTNRDVAEARLATARLQLEKSRVRAPWAGRVAARRVEAGDFVAPGTPLFELVDASRLKVRAPARSADVPYLAVGREVEVTVDAFPGELFRARIERLGAELDVSSRTLEVEAEIANPEGRLRPGMLARLELSRQKLEGALVVPQSAVIDLEGSKAVYVIEDGRAERRQVTLGPAFGEEVVVEGLAAGDKVIVEGLHLVSDGQLVEEV
ncbi:MAG TPA: efflux RND transporter periplasmic adaptor subunit [Thermoanaerobaculia bacterium]|nr:efflux RND transporter periplasmic adaptor subunit [Thermoanaerobaculia bacterium]